MPESPPNPFLGGFLVQHDPGWFSPGVASGCPKGPQNPRLGRLLVQHVLDRISTDVPLGHAKMVLQFSKARITFEPIFGFVALSGVIFSFFARFNESL